jgi:predicted lipoprotein with Yx(FWY)xxD motif
VAIEMQTARTAKTRASSLTKSAAVAIGLGALVILAACGSSSKATVTPGAQPQTSTPTTASGSAPVVTTASSSGLGTILVDSKGMTVYTLTNAGKAVACTGQCATFWPPLVLPAGTVTALGAHGITGVATATTPAGLQVTDNGLPLYRFSKDKAPGDTNGEGLATFGGTWHVVKSAAASTTPATDAPVVPSPPATEAPTTTSNPYGY